MSLTLPNARPAAPSEPGSLFDALARVGRRRRSSGNQRFPILEPDRVHLVVRGRVDLFLVELRSGVPQGPRSHLCTAEEGRLLLGIDSAQALTPIGFLAVPTVGTVVAELAFDTFRSLAGEPEYREEAAALIEKWVSSLSGASAAAVADPPALKRSVSPGESAAVHASDRITTSAPTGWMLLHGRRALFLDSADVADGALFPLCPATWVAIGAAGAVPCVDTESALASGFIWNALASFHAAVADVLPTLLRLGAIDEVNRLNRRLEDETKALESAEMHLASVVSPQNHPAAGTQAQTDPLVDTLQLIARALSWPLVVPSRRDGEPRPSLDDILRASTLRKREVVLEDGWWRDDVTPLLLMEGPGGKPAALLRRGQRLLLWPSAGPVQRLTRRAASQLGGEAYLLYEPLPERPLPSAYLMRRTWEVGRREILAAVVLSVVAGLLSLLFPVIIGYVAEDLIPSRDIPGLVEIAGILCVVAALQFLLRFGGQRALLRLEGVAGTRMQAAIMDRVLRLPTAFFRGASAGDTATRVMSLKSSVDAFTGAVMGSMFGASVLASSLFIMIRSASALVPMAMLALAVLTSVSVALGLGRHKHEKDVVRLRGQISGHVLEMMRGIVKLRLAAAENRAFVRWAELYAALARKGNAAKLVERRTGLTMAAFTIGAQAALFLVVAESGAAESGVWLGSLVTFLSAFNQAVGGAAGLATSAITLAALKPTLQHASPILAGTPERSQGGQDPGRLSGAIEIGAVHFAYGTGGPLLLQGLSVQIRPGEFVALVGPSGGGKSTILRLLLGFEAPQRGAIFYDSKDLRSLDIQAVRAQIGVVLQRGRLFGMSLEENILGAHRQLGPEAAWRAAEEVGIADDIRAMPMGMETVVVEGGLSGGQLQRILLARALVHRPRILLLDEATSALDNHTQAHVADTLAELSATRIIIAHRLSTVAAAHRILVVDGGVIAESGTYAELIAKGGLFAEIAARQLAS